MIKPIMPTMYSQSKYKKEKSTQKSPNFGQMTYFIDGVKPVVCSQKKEASLLKRFIKSLKSNLLYNQGPKSYKNNDSSTHILTNGKGSTMFTLDENYDKVIGKHVIDINVGQNKDNTTVFIYEDKENKPFLEEIRRRIEKMRKRDNSFSHMDANA